MSAQRHFGVQVGCKAEYRRNDYVCPRTSREAGIEGAVLIPHAAPILPWVKDTLKLLAILGTGVALACLPAIWKALQGVML